MDFGTLDSSSLGSANDAIVGSLNLLRDFAFFSLEHTNPTEIGPAFLGSLEAAWSLGSGQLPPQ